MKEKNIIISILAFIILMTALVDNAKCYENATADIIPWSGYWWPEKKGELALGFYGPPGPMEKYDLYHINKGLPNPGAKDWELNNHYNPTGPGWFGHCHAWAAASVLESQPVIQTNNLGIDFGVGDQKGLITESNYNITLDLMIGTRYWGPGDVFEDIHPIDFHAYLRSWIKNRGEPIVMDIEPLEAVWNYPAYKYEMSTEIDQLDSSKMHVTCKVWFVDDGVEPNYIGTKDFVKIYTYYVTVNETGTVIMGPNGWEGKSIEDHPDFIWHPASANPAQGCPLNYDTVLHLCKSPIEKGVEWLRENQLTNGSWSNNAAITSLAVLAMLNAGYEESDQDINAGIQYILSQINADGSVGNVWYRYTYYTSIAILPMVATHNQAYEDKILKMRQWLIDSQWDEDSYYSNVDPTNWYYGGFGYGNGTRPDLSNTQWALMGLSASGLQLGHETYNKALVFLERCQHEDGGSGYTPYYYDSIHTMTAASVWSYVLCSVSQNDSRVANGLKWLSDNYSLISNDGWGRVSDYYYAITLSKALSMSHKTYLGEHDWFAELAHYLTGLQLADGNWPGGGWLSGQEDLELTSCYSILSLQTRTLPLGVDMSMSIILASHADLHVYDTRGRHIGINYETMKLEEKIPGSTFLILDKEGNEIPFDGTTPENGERQVINLPLLNAGSYRVELKGTSNGPCHLTINGMQNGQTVTTKTYEAEISSGDIFATSTTATAMEGSMTLLYEPLTVMPKVDVDPKELTIVAVPGQNFTVPFNVSEVGGVATLHSVDILVTDITGRGGSRIPSSAISLDNNSFNIAAGGSVNVNATIPIPPDFNGPCSGAIIIESVDGGSQRINLTLLTTIEVQLDIMPEDCPDEVSVKSKGVLPVTILGSGEIDVEVIDPASVRLQGIQPKRWSYEDITRPYDNCNNYYENPDGFNDLNLKFDKKNIIQTIGVVPAGQIIPLRLTGNLKVEFGGIQIQGVGIVTILDN